MDLDCPNKILITCARGNMPFLTAEVNALGYPIESSHDTGIVTKADFFETYRLNLELRTAFNVLFLLKEFKCSDPDELYSETHALEWEKIIPSKEYISINADYRS